jgi:quinolinate synthase
MTDKTQVIAEIKKLKKDKNITIVAHNYQLPEIQEIADICGDSLELAKIAATLDTPNILFCGVKFMAETAKIVAPEKNILLPVKDATCPMAHMIKAEDIIDFKKEHPNAKVVCYVNSTTEVKAVSDVCCTSSNAVNIVKNIDANEIFFVPDKNLGSYCQRFIKDKTIHLWPGHCYVHSKITPAEVKAAKENYPEAEVLVHPECEPEIVDLADHAMSTSKMLTHVNSSDKKTFLIGTEQGLIDRLIKENPDKKIFPAGTSKICVNMKKIKLEDVYNSLKENKYQIEVAGSTAEKAKMAIEKMFEVDKK